jgi:hypothetical protein
MRSALHIHRAHRKAAAAKPTDRGFARSRGFLYGLDLRPALAADSAIDSLSAIAFTVARGAPFVRPEGKAGLDAAADGVEGFGFIWDEGYYSHVGGPLVKWN